MQVKEEGIKHGEVLLGALTASLVFQRTSEVYRAGVIFLFPALLEAEKEPGIRSEMVFKSFIFKGIYSGCSRIWGDILHANKILC